MIVDYIYTITKCLWIVLYTIPQTQYDPHTSFNTLCVLFLYVPCHCRRNLSALQSTMLLLSCNRLLNKVATCKQEANVLKASYT